MNGCRAYQDADREACLGLLRRGHDPRFSEERFRWLHEEGPGGRSHAVVFESDGRVVGLYAVLPRPAVLDGRPIVAGRDVDPVVDPAWRGRGLFTRMLEWMLAHGDGVDVYYNFANAASAPGFLKRGWSVTDTLVDHAAQLGYRRLASREGLLWAASRLVLPHGDRAGIDELAPAEIAALPAPLAPAGRRFAVDRTAAFLTWRYCRSPLQRYRVFARRDAAGIRDLLVVRVDAERRRLFLVDLVVYRPDGGRFAAYLPRVAADLDVGWAGVWSTCPAAWRRGFLRSPRARGLPLLVRFAPGRERLAAGLGRGDCHVTYGDVEVN